MYTDLSSMMRILLGVTLFVSSEAFFMRWGSENSQPQAPKTWLQPLSPGMVPAYRAYSYSYMPYDQRKMYQPLPQYGPPEPQPMAQGMAAMGQGMATMPQGMATMAQSMAPIPISVPAGSNLTPVSLQHVQLVPCMCPVAPEEAEKLQESVGPGPYLAQAYQGQQYAPPPPADPASQPKQ